MANKIYRGKIVEKKTIDDLYNRLGVLRTRDSLPIISKPDLTQKKTAASDINSLFSFILDTKNASTFLKNTSLVTFSTIIAGTIMESTNSVSKIEYNIAQLEAACVHNATNRSGYSTTINDPKETTTFSTFFVSNLCQTVFSSHFGSFTSCGSDHSDKTSNFVSNDGTFQSACGSHFSGKCSVDGVNSPVGCGSYFSSNRSSYTPASGNSTNFSPNSTHNFSHFHEARTDLGFTGKKVTVHSTNKKSGGASSSPAVNSTNFSGNSCSSNNSTYFGANGGCSGNTLSFSRHNSSNFSGNNSSNFNRDFADATCNTVFSSRNSTVVNFCNVVNSSNFTNFCSSNCPSNNASNFSVNKSSDKNVVNTSYTVEGI